MPAFMARPRARSFPQIAIFLAVFGYASVALAVAADDQPESATVVAARSYFEAYIARDWDQLANWLDESGSFRDPTATAVFGPVAASGKAALLTYFQRNYAAIEAMRFEPMRTVHSGDYVIFEGTLAWDLRLADGVLVSTRDMPFLTILHLHDGRVIEHLDYADYTPFLAAHQAAISAAGSSDTD
jgi:ketosteroid isomerase-like protein